MTNCDYEPSTLTCRVCGHVAKRLPTYRKCKPVPPPASRTPPNANGPGYYATKLLSWVGIRYTPDCECASMAARMDYMGIDWCLSDVGMSEILATMKREHEKRKMLIPWSDAAAIGLVKTACELAERDAKRCNSH